MGDENSEVSKQANISAKAARMKTPGASRVCPRGTTPVSSVIVPFNDCGTGPAFYCVHPITGSAGSYRSLSEMLGPELNFFGVQTPTKMRNPAFATSIEAVSSFLR